MEEIGCARPTGGPVGGAPGDEASASDIASTRREGGMIKVGQKAPDFTAPSFHEGKFGSVQLSEHLGKWVVLCFYPGDYTFV